MTKKWYTGRDPNKAFKMQYDLAREIYVTHVEVSAKSAFDAAEDFLEEAYERKVKLREKMQPIRPYAGDIMISGSMADLQTWFRGSFD